MLHFYLLIWIIIKCFFIKNYFKRLRINSKYQPEFLFVYYLLEIVLKQIALSLTFYTDDTQLFLLYVSSTYDIIITG